ncbi:MAG: hypothetical protein ABSA81_01800 [Candidatus Bathyarchaeia archaeon]
MTYLYLDIETVPDFESSEEYLASRSMIENGKLTPQSNSSLYYRVTMGALNPHQGKTIAIAYSIGDEDLQILEEWVSSERETLQKFYDVLDKATRESWKSKTHLTYVGFNILHFDIPFLFCRMQYHEIRTSSSGHDPIWLYRKLFWPSVDLLQMHLHLNHCVCEGLNHDAVCCAYGLPIKDIHGDVIKDLYYQREYQKIEKYIRDEFLHRDILERILTEGIVDAERFRSSVDDIKKRKADSQIRR